MTDPRDDPPAFLERLRQLLRRVTPGRAAGGESGAGRKNEPAARSPGTPLAPRDQYLADRSQRVMEAELRALRLQLNPYFLFNALSTLGHAMHTDRESAGATLRQILNLLRGVMSQMNCQLVPLADEVERLRSYTALERRLDLPALELDAIAPDCTVARLPEFLIDAAVASVAGGEAGSRDVIEVRAIREPGAEADGFLRLVVSRRSPRSRSSSSRVDPALLAVVDRRLQQHFGIRAGASARTADDGLASLDIVVPWIDRDATPVVGSM